MLSLVSKLKPIKANHIRKSLSAPTDLAREPERSITNPRRATRKAREILNLIYPKKIVVVK